MEVKCVGEPNRFEKIVANHLRTLSSISGYAFFGYSFSLKGKICQIDCIVYLNPGAFVCLEIKGYSGIWTGGLNEEWKSNGSIIRSKHGINPFEQVREYTYFIKDVIEAAGLKSPFIHSMIVAESDAHIRVSGISVNKVNDYSVHNLSNLENAFLSLRNKKPQQDTREILRFLFKFELPDTKKTIDANSVEKPIRNPAPPPKIIPRSPSSSKTQSIRKPQLKPKMSRNNLGLMVIPSVVMGLLGFTATYFLVSSPCPSPKEKRVLTSCYKDLKKAPLVIGVLTDPQNYLPFKNYLLQKMGSNLSGITIEGGRQIKYQEVRKKDN